MDNVSEKLGLYDFFNVVSVGAIFILHIVVLFPDMLSDYDQWLSDGTIKFTGLFILAYLVGLVFQEFGANLDEYRFCKEKYIFIKKKLICSFLTNNKVIDNSIKLQQYRKYAKDILSRRGIEVSENLTKEQNEYIYTYLEYYIEHKQKNKKLEKMRALYGMSKSLFCCMGIIGVICSAGCLLSCNMYGFDSKRAAYMILYVVVAMCIYYFRALRCMKYRIRMMLGVYESCINEKEEIQEDMHENVFI